MRAERGKHYDRLSSRVPAAQKGRVVLIPVLIPFRGLPQTTDSAGGQSLL